MTEYIDEKKAHANYNRDTFIIVGCEHKGLSQKLRTLPSVDLVNIEMALTSKYDSVNVNVATAIFLNQLFSSTK